MIKLLIAFILGGMFGTVIMAVCAASGHASECEECWRLGRRNGGEVETTVKELDRKRP